VDWTRRETSNARGNLMEKPLGKHLYTTLYSSSVVNSKLFHYGFHLHNYLHISWLHVSTSVMSSSGHI
jgi:hypothetical protein